MTQSTPRSVLVLRLSALGDVIHTLPAVAALRRAVPRVRIGWVVERTAALLLEGNPVVDDLFIIDTRSTRHRQGFLPGLAALFQLVVKLRQIRYECVLEFQGLFKSAVLGWLSGAGRRIGLCKELRREGLSAWFVNEQTRLGPGRRHVIEINNSLAEACAVAVDSWDFPLPETTRQEVAVQTQLDRLGLTEFAIINPGAGWITKTWPGASYARLSRRITKELALPCLFTWGPADEAVAAAIQTELGPLELLTFPTTFLDLIPLLKRARLFIGGDTGPMQLAAALGTPVVAIFGPTTPARNGPFASGDIVLHRELHCSHCYLRRCPYHLECLDISVDEVFVAVKKRLGV